MTSTLLGGLTAGEFLSRYWQKKPFLVRGAFPEFVDPLTPDELAGLAMEQDVKARLVFEKGRRPWQLLHGPFSESRLRRLPKSHWSLLVSRVNEYCEPAAEILDQFKFIPHWRCDDLMVSFAPPMGTVGAHVDSYDVFLIQGKGRRRWQIQQNPRPDLVADIDLKILKYFESDAEWILEPGDMLYLPPGVAHFGVALEDCMTYSVGFRAPSHGDLWRELFNMPQNLWDGLSADEMYKDPHLKEQENPGLLSPEAIASLSAILAEPLKHPEIMGRWLGAYLTRQGDTPRLASTGRRLAPQALALRLETAQVVRADHIRVAYLAPAKDRFSFFVDGQEHSLDVRLLPLAKTICQARFTSGRSLLKSLPRAAKAREGALTFVAELIREGLLFLA